VLFAHCISRVVALNGHDRPRRGCLLSRVKRTPDCRLSRSASDPDSDIRPLGPRLKIAYARIARDDGAPDFRACGKLLVQDWRGSHFTRMKLFREY